MRGRSAAICGTWTTRPGASVVRVRRAHSVSLKNLMPCRAVEKCVPGDGLARPTRGNRRTYVLTETAGSSALRGSWPDEFVTADQATAALRLTVLALVRTRPAAEHRDP